MAVAVLIGANGTPVACEVMRSSGSNALDEATGRLSGRHGRFEPARDADGRAVEARFAMPACGGNSIGDAHVDETPRHAYVGATVNLLLLLSALLSALSGVSTQAPVRAPVAASPKVRLAAVRATATVRVAQWPVPALPGAAAVARAPLAAPIAAAPAIALLLTDRRRE